MDITLIPAWISNNMRSQACDELTHLSPNLTVAEVWEWTSNFIPHFIIDLITYP